MAIVIDLSEQRDFLRLEIRQLEIQKEEWLWIKKRPKKAHLICIVYLVDFRN